MSAKLSIFYLKLVRLVNYIHYKTLKVICPGLRFNYHPGIAKDLGLVQVDIFVLLMSDDHFYFISRLIWPACEV